MVGRQVRQAVQKPLADLAFYPIAVALLGAGLRQPLALAPPTPVPHVAHVERKGAQPGRKTVWIAQHGQLEPGLHKGVVGQILGVPGRAGHISAEGVDQPLIARHQNAKGVAPAWARSIRVLLWAVKVISHYH